MRILLISSSARGHAIAEALARSPRKPEIIAICPNRNPGIRKLAAELHLASVMDFPKILEIAQKSKPDFAVISDDDPIGAGLADELEKIGIPSIAPKKTLAQIESSKGFTRRLLEKYGIKASPKFFVFERTKNSHKAQEEEKNMMYKIIDQELDGEYVVKYDALKGGKGVKLSGEHLATVDHGVDYAMDCLDECGRVVIEEKLIGVEFSLMSFVSGTSVVDMPAVQDHKRAYEGDTGPNTGGMGTYSDADHSLPFLESSDLARAKEINRLTAEALMKECQEPYKGILYGGFIAVKDGVRVIEYNARFGDPEALNVLPILSSDFVDICQGIISGELRDDLVNFQKKASVCKYIVPRGYPDNKDQKGEFVRFPDIGRDVWPNAPTEDACIYYGDVSEDKDGTLHLGGSRTAGIVGIGSTIAEAGAIVEKLCEQVEGPIRFRKDIGTVPLVQKRNEMMKSLRS